MDLVVMDVLPLVRLGAITALGGGTEVGSHAELTSGLARREPAILLLGLHEEDEAGWALLASLKGHAQLRSVVLLWPFSLPLAAAALRAGAVHVLPRDADADSLRRVVAEVRRGVVSVPIELFRAATALTTASHTAVRPTDEELGWLRALGDGSTVAALAESAGMSERVLYRRLGQLYRRLGVAGRTQAMMLGREEGWL